MSLPYEQIMEICSKGLQEESYNFRKLQSKQEFIENVKDLTTKFIDGTEFSGLSTHSEEIQLFNNEAQDANDKGEEEKTNENESDESEHFEDEEEKEVLMLEKPPSPIVKRALVSQSSYLIRKENLIQGKILKIIY